MTKSVNKPASVARVRSTYDMGNWRDMNSLFGIGKSILKRISEAEALFQGAVSAAVDVLSQDIAKARLRLVMSTNKGTRVLDANEHALARRLMLDPNEHQTWHEVCEMLIRHLAIHQNAYLVKMPRTQNSRDPDLIPVHPQRVTQNAVDGRFFYDVTAGSTGDATLLGFVGSRRFSQDEIIHIKGRMHTGEMGLSTLLIGGGVLGLNQAILDFQAGLVSSGLRPNAVIEAPGNFSDEQFQRLKAEINDMMSKAVTDGKPALLEGGAKYAAVSRNAQETDLTRARQLLRQEVAALWRIPAYKIGAGETEKYDNKATAEQTYVDDALIPQAIRVEAILAKAMLTDNERLKGIGFIFDRDDLYDRDRQQASDRIVKQFEAGVIPRGLACAKLGYDAPPDELDTYRIPVNAAILHKDGRLEFVTPNKAEAPNQEVAP